MRRSTMGAAIVGATCMMLLGSTQASATGSSGQLRCGDTVTGTVVLAEDLHCDDVGLVLLPGAVLDLNGNELVGPGREIGGVALETTFDDVPDGDPAPAVLVHDGVVRGWSSVFPLASTVRATLRDALVQDNAVVLDGVNSSLDLERSRFVRNGLVAFAFNLELDVVRSTFVDNSTVLSVGPPGTATVRRSTFTGNGVAISCSEGIIEVTSSRFRDNTEAVNSDACGATVTGSEFRDNGTGVSSRMIFPGGSLATDVVVGNRFVGNDVALRIGVRTVVQDNRFVRNGMGVLSQSAGTPFEVEDVTVVGNVLTRGSDGVVIDTVAHVGDNVAIRNDGFGLNVPLAVDLGGNIAARNGVDCVGVSCAP